MKAGEAIAEIHVARTAEPQLFAVPWYGLGHGKRILRWLFSQPPRVQTVISVKAALESVAGATKANT